MSGEGVIAGIFAGLACIVGGIVAAYGMKMHGKYLWIDARPDTVRIWEGTDGRWHAVHDIMLKNDTLRWRIDSLLAAYETKVCWED